MFSFLTRRPGGQASGDSVRISVARGAFDPSEIHAVAGHSVRITFHRDDPSACAERVVFPALALERRLPLDRDVTVELTPEKPGEIQFACGMGMLHGRLIVAAPEHATTAGCHGHAAHARPSHGAAYAHGGDCCGGGHRHGLGPDRAANQPPALAPDTNADPVEHRGHEHA